jgi:adenosylcobinamide-GDP ribazoletransferase
MAAAGRSGAVLTRAWGALGSEILAATTFLTRVRVRAPATDTTGGAAFGVVGALIGVAAALPLVVLGDRAPLAAGALAVGALAGLSGGLHLDGLADSIDALAAPSREAAERARRDPRVGAAGAAALAIVLVTEASLLAAVIALAGPVTAALVCVTAAAGSRAVAVAAARLARAQGPEEGRGQGLGAWFVHRAGAAAAIVAPASALVLGAAFAFAVGRPALVLGLLAGTALAIVLGGWLLRVRGALDGDGFGFLIEIAFAAILLLTVLTL